MSLSWLSRVLLLCLFLLPALDSVAAPAQSLNAAAIKKIVNDSEILSPEYHQQVYSSFGSGVASISLFRHPDSTREDCKIEAVLLARKIIALAPAAVQRVRCVFYDYDRQNEYWDVEVRAQLVSAFAEGKIGQRDLLDSVQLKEDKQANPLSEKYAAASYQAILDEDSVCAGAHSEKRLATSLRLKELQRQNVDLGKFKEQFLRIEDAARRGKDAELPKQIEEINKDLDLHVKNLVSTGQIRKPELRRASKTSLGAQAEPSLDPLMGI